MVDGLKTEVANRFDVKVMNLSQADAAMEQLANELKVEYVPTFVFVNSDGTIGKTTVGGITKEEMLNELAKLK